MPTAARADQLGSDSSGEVPPRPRRDGSLICNLAAARLPDPPRLPSPSTPAWPAAPASPPRAWMARGACLTAPLRAELILLLRFRHALHRTGPGPEIFATHSTGGVRSEKCRSVLVGWN